jgi:hypothetical protein
MIIWLWKTDRLLAIHDPCGGKSHCANAVASILWLGMVRDVEQQLNATGRRHFATVVPRRRDFDCRILGLLRFQSVRRLFRKWPFLPSLIDATFDFVMTDLAGRAAGRVGKSHHRRGA